MPANFQFDFEELDVYKLALNFVDRVFERADGWPVTAQRRVGDHLCRTPVSIPANIAEGSGKLSKLDQRRYYDIARGSARECIPMLGISQRRGYLEPHEYAELRTMVVRLCQMLTRLMASRTR